MTKTSGNPTDDISGLLEDGIGVFDDTGELHVPLRRGRGGTPVAGTRGDWGLEDPPAPPIVPAPGMNDRVSSWTARNIIAPAILAIIQPTGLDREQAGRVHDAVRRLIPAGLPPEALNLHGAVKLLFGMEFRSLPLKTRCETLDMLLAWMGLTEEVGLEIFGEDIWRALPFHWNQRVAELDTSDDAVAPVEVAAGATDARRDVATGVIVVREIGNSDNDSAKRADKAVTSLVQKPLPLFRSNRLDTFRERMLADFPHAAAAIDDLYWDLTTRDHVAWTPRILVGNPGVGKTSFVEAACLVLEIPYLKYPCGGDTDSVSFRGASRKWSTTSPSLPLSLIASHQIANPVIILDEIEKAGTSRYNGNLLDVLLGMMDRKQASGWYDPHVEAPIDLRHVNWLATANSTKGLPPAIRDRFRMVSRIADPAAEHGPHLVKALLRQVVAERGPGAAMIEPLGLDEIEAITGIWGGGSVRQLQTVLEHWLRQRDRSASRH